MFNEMIINVAEGRVSFLLLLISVLPYLVFGWAHEGYEWQWFVEHVNK